jgi:nicotinamidase-related amidase
VDKFNSSGTALILIDIQKGFSNIDYWGGERNNPHAENNAGKLLNTWRKFNLPFFHVQHCSSNPNSILAPGSPGNAFKDIVLPKEGETIIQKNVNSAFIGTDLKKLLDDQKIDTVVIVGLTTEHCVSTTARMSGNFGYKTFVVSDATAAFNKKGINNEKYNAETIHLTALAMIKDEFATIVTTNEILEQFG